jgi:tRNA(fMet)-specific endonuclease VapC
VVVSRRVILDTNIFIAAVKGELKLTSIIGHDDPALAAVTAMELLLGVDNSVAQSRDEEALQIEGYFASLPIEPYTLDVARTHALLVNRARKTGRPRGTFDLIIAATASTSGRTLLTTDAKAGFDELPGVKAEVVKVG